MRTATPPESGGASSRTSDSNSTRTERSRPSARPHHQQRDPAGPYGRLPNDEMGRMQEGKDKPSEAHQRQGGVKRQVPGFAKPTAELPSELGAGDQHMTPDEHGTGEQQLIERKQHRR